MASYNNNEESPHEPDGVALVWNNKFKKTSPEFVFHFQVSNKELIDSLSLPSSMSSLLKRKHLCLLLTVGLHGPVVRLQDLQSQGCGLKSY